MRSPNTYLLLSIFASLLVLISAGLDLPAEVKDLVSRKFNKIALDCSEKGVAIGDIEPTITACLEEFNRLGAQEIELPPRPENVTYEDDPKAFEEYWMKRQEVKINSVCYQVNTALDCLQPLKTITDECRSAEGITILKLLSVGCQNNGSAIFDLSQDRCGFDFREAYQTCGQENGLFEKYVEGNSVDPAFEDFCGFGSTLIECTLKAFEAASKPACKESSKTFNNFIEQLKVGSETDSEAVTACLLGGSSA